MADFLLNHHLKQQQNPKVNHGKPMMPTPAPMPQQGGVGWLVGGSLACLAQYSSKFDKI